MRLTRRYTLVHFYSHETVGTEVNNVDTGSKRLPLWLSDDRKRPTGVRLSFLHPELYQQICSFHSLSHNRLSLNRCVFPACQNPDPM